MSQLALSASFEYVCYGPLEIFQFFQCWDLLYMSEPDVYRRQVLRYKDGPRTERVKVAPKKVQADGILSGATPVLLGLYIYG